MAGIRWWLEVAAGGLAAVALAAGAQEKQAQEGRPGAAATGPETILGAVVHVRAKALADARSSRTLGASREGSGIVIDASGHVLTIGYLVIEPESIEITTGDNKTMAATLAAYDHASGFALLRPLGSLGVRPLELGSSARIEENEPVMILPFGGRDNASIARVVSKRRFTGSWEYMLESALFVAPPSFVWAGAALVNRDLQLVGVGSLLVRDSAAPGQQQPGNMFVPIDLLKPILPDLIRQGRRDGPVRPWLGMAADELQGRLIVSRVSEEGPAERAGIRQGDIVLGVGSDPVRTQAELYSRMWGLGAAGVEVPLKVLQGAEMRDIRVKSIDRTEYFRGKRVD